MNNSQDIPHYREVTFQDTLPSRTECNSSHTANRMGLLVSPLMPSKGQCNQAASEKSKPKVDALQLIVLKWSTNDITNSSLFKTQMQEIPMEFSSTAEYLRAFRVPLLEEVRSQLHQALEKSITKSEGIPVRVTKFIALNAKKNKDPSLRRFILSRSWFARKSTAVRYSDLILLCCHKLPQWDSRRECLSPQTHHNFALVNVAYAKDESPNFTVTAYLPDGSPILEQLLLPAAQSPSWFAVLLGTSLLPADRIWNAIDTTNSEAQGSKTSVMEDVLQINQQIEPAGLLSLALPQQPEAAETLQLVENFCNSRRLNDSQKYTLKSAVAGLLTTDSKCHVRMVQGPPGTGKTAMLVALISTLECLQVRTLVSAPTNAAVFEVCKRMINFTTVNSEEEKKQQSFSAFCSMDSGSLRSGKERRCCPVQLFELVLLGSKGKMEGFVKNTLLEKVFLPFRIKRLTAAMCPKTGWKGSIDSLETFLTNAPAQFKLKYPGTANGPIKERNGSFWSFAKEFMHKMQVQMEKHMQTLTSELPRCHIDEKTCKAMTSTLGSMKRIVNAMPLRAPDKAVAWFTTTKTDPLSEVMANLSLSESQSSNSQRKVVFLQARDALLTALATRAGCKLLATKINPGGRQPKYEWLKSQCIQHATLLFCTVSTAGSPPMVKATFQCAIIDEASQLVEAESVIVSGKRGLQQLILVGDHKQLPATVISKAAEKSGYGRSLFGRLQILKHGCRHMLNIQYRMKPELNLFPNSQFYESEVYNGSNVLSENYGVHLAGASHYGAYAFVNCWFGVEESQQKSWKNSTEVAVVKKMVKHLEQVCLERDIKKLSIGVISPYAMQVEAVKQSLGHLHEALEVDVKTVDGFQGNERDVIIFTTVRANHSKQIGFVQDERRLNVAITRGRYCLWIVGNATTLSRGAKVWKDLITDAKTRNCFFDLKL